MNKIMKTFSLFSIFLLLLCCIGCTRRNSNNNENKSDEKYEATLEEIEQINNNSYFLGLNLLAEPPDGAVSGIPLTFRNETSEDIYYVGSYHKNASIVAMKLRSKDANFMGIFPGDNKQIIQDNLEQTNFVQIESPVEDGIRYEAFHIILDFEIAEDQFIKSIGISIADPTEDTIDY
ncbi:hypothetical protein [Anaerosporobacter sp.]